MSLLSNQQKKAYIQKLKNFPTVPLYQPRGTKQNLLFEYYPWGCEHIREKQNPFNPQIDKCDGIIVDNYVNLLLGAKYGIVSVQMDKFIDLYKKFQRLKADQKFFLKLYCPQYKLLILHAMGRIIQFYPEKTFRFWKYTIKDKNYYGVIRLDYFAIGKVNFNEDQISKQMDDSIFFNLKNSPLQWSLLVLTDEYEWEKRRQYIRMLEQEEIQKFDKKEKEKNQQLLQKVENLKFINGQG